MRAPGASLNASADSPSRAALREIEADFEVLPTDEHEFERPSGMSWTGKLALLFIVALVVTGGAVLAFTLMPTKKSGDGRVRTRVVVNTWWPGATDATFAALANDMSALDAAIAGAVDAEVNEGYGDHTVGPNGSPDTNGETTLDALIVRADCARACTRAPCAQAATSRAQPTCHINPSAPLRSTARRLTSRAWPTCGASRRRSAPRAP